MASRGFHCCELKCSVCSQRHPHSQQLTPRGRCRAPAQFPGRFRHNRHDMHHQLEENSQSLHPCERVSMCVSAYKYTARCGQVWGHVGMSNEHTCIHKGMGVCESVLFV